MPHVSAMLLLLVLVVTTSAPAQPLSFTRNDYPSVAGARAVVVADFDRDGWPDVAQANTGRNTVTVLLNQHGVGLARMYDIPVGSSPFEMTTGDFNRDGIPDLAVANADGHSITILLGRGTGNFIRAANLPAPTANPRGVTTADVNNDGKPDLVYTGYAAGAVQVLMGDGDGGFSPGPSDVDRTLQPQGVAAADFDRDGHLDLAVAYDTPAGGLRVLYGNGGTTLTARAISGDSSLSVVAAADLNGDGWPDVVAASTDNSRVGVYLGGASGLVYAQSYATGSSPRSIAIGDVDGDGIPDVVTANRGSNTVTLLLGDPQHRGAFQLPVEVSSAVGSRTVAIADLNGDARLDVVTGNEYAVVVTVLSNTTLLDRAAYTFGRTLVGRPSGVIGGPDDVWVADFNRDGRPDLLTLARREPWTMSVLLAGGQTVSLAGAGLPDGFAIADVNGDGNPDVIYKGCCPSGTVNALVGDGRGGFKATPPSTSATQLGAFAMADVNRDARPDLVFEGVNPSTGEAVLQIMMGVGDGTFRDFGRVVLGAVAVDVRIADINRDGKPDVLVLTSNRTVQIWHGDGGGGLVVASAVTFATEAPADVKVADLNRDGYPDLVVAGGDLGTAGGQASVEIALGGPGGFGPPSEYPITPWGQRGRVLALADVDLDGTVDIITAGGDLLRGKGDGSFAAGERFDFQGVGVRVADNTGDGLPDILFGTSQGEVGVLVNQRNGINRAPLVSAGPDVTIPYERQVFGDPSGPGIVAAASDPDQHALMFEWRDPDGVVVSTSRALTVWNRTPGAYEYTLTVQDGRGATVTDSVVVTIANTKEIMLYLSNDRVSYHGFWSLVGDSTAAGGGRAHDINWGAPKAPAPLAAPTHYVSREFIADPTQVYKLWVRLKADDDVWANDSVWMQFSGVTDVAGRPKYRTGTTSGLSVSLEECVDCGVAGWGWEDDEYGAYNKNGVLLRFPEGGVQRLVIQSREDGVSVDQVVLSAEKYLTTRPGLAKHDATVLPATWTPF